MPDTLRYGGIFLVFYFVVGNRLAKSFCHELVISEGLKRVEISRVIEGEAIDNCVY